MSNLFSFPESFDDVYWSKLNFVITPNDIAAPDLTTTADKIICNTAGSGYVFRAISIVLGIKYAYSVFVKKGDTDYFVLDNQISTSMVVNLNNGIVTDTQTGAGATLNDYGTIDYGNDWYRVWMIFTSAFSFSSNFFLQQSDSSEYLSRNAPENSHCYMWGAMLSQSDVLEEYISVSGWHSTIPALPESKTFITILW